MTRTRGQAPDHEPVRRTDPWTHRQLRPAADGESPVPIHERMRPLRRLAAELEASDPYTSGHSRRVSRYSTLIGSQLGLAAGALRRLGTAGMLHDVGKIAVPAAILHKPSGLTAAEFSVIQSHADRGADMIADLVEDRELVAIVRHHHERFDGTGYPGGLAGQTIPLGSRVIAVADTFDAIVSRRPYRRAGSFARALSELAAVAGGQLDPRLVAAFCSVYEAIPPMDVLSDAGDELLRSAPWQTTPGRPGRHPLPLTSAA